MQCAVETTILLLPQINMGDLTRFSCAYFHGLVDCALLGRVLDGGWVGAAKVTVLFLLVAASFFGPV